MEGNIFKELGFNLPDSWDVPSKLTPTQTIPFYFLAQMGINTVANVYNSIMSGREAKMMCDVRKGWDDDDRKAKRALSEREINDMKEQHRKNLEFQRQRNKENMNDLCSQSWFRTYVKDTWNKMFNLSADAAIELHEECARSNQPRPLQVMLIRNNDLDSTFQRPSHSVEYQYLCDDIRGTQLERDFSTDFLMISKDSRGYVADTINLHYLMQGIPSLLIFPRINGDCMVLDTAMWGYKTGNENIFYRANALRLETKNKQQLRQDIIQGTNTLASIVSDSFKTFLCLEKTDSLEKNSNLLPRFSTEISNFRNVYNLCCGNYKAFL